MFLEVANLSLFCYSFRGFDKYQISKFYFQMEVNFHG